MKWLIDRLNVKAVAMLIALLLAIGGLILVYAGVKDDGVIDIEMAILKGKFQSGSIGLLIILTSFLITATCLMSKPKPHEIELKGGKYSVKWKGAGPYRDDAVVKDLSAVIIRLFEDERNPNRKNPPDSN